MDFIHLLISLHQVHGSKYPCWAVKGKSRCGQVWQWNPLQDLASFVKIKGKREERTIQRVTSGRDVTSALDMVRAQ